MMSIINGLNNLNGSKTFSRNISFGYHVLAIVLSIDLVILRCASIYCIVFSNSYERDLVV